MKQVLEEFLLLGEGELVLQEMLLVVGEEVSLEKCEIVLDEGGQLHATYLSYYMK